MSDRLTTEYADLVNIYNKEQNFIRQNDSILPVIHIAWLYNKNVEIIDAPASEYKLPEVINTHFDELFSSCEPSPPKRKRYGRGFPSNQAKDVTNARSA